MSEPIEHQVLPQSSRVARRRLSMGEVVAWGVIVLAIVAIFVVPMIRRAMGRDVAEASDGPDVRLLITSRYVVGVNVLAPEKVRGRLGALVKAAEGQAKTADDKFDVAILRGELEGREAEAADFVRLRMQYPQLSPEIDLVERMQAGAILHDSEEWKGFRLRHGWFADLAESAGKPPEDPFRHGVMMSGLRTVGSLVGFILLVIVAGLAGLALLIVGIVLVVRKRIGSALGRDDRLPADRRLFLQGFAIYLVIMLLGGLGLSLLNWLLHGALPTGLGVRTAMLFAAFGIGAGWPLMRGQGVGAWRASMGLHGGRGVIREVFSGVVGFLAGLPVVAMGMLVTLALTKLSGVSASHPIVQEVTSGPARLLFWLFLATVWAPVAEELMFRGALFAHMRERFGFLFSALTVSLVFAIIHPQGWVGLPVLMSIAMVLAAIREWRGSIVGSMVAHSLNNTAVMAMLVVAVS